MASDKKSDGGKKPLSGITLIASETADKHNKPNARQNDGAEFQIAAESLTDKHSLEESQKSTNQMPPAGNNGKPISTNLEANNNVESKPKKKKIKRAIIPLSHDDLSRLNTNKGLISLLRNREIKLKDVLDELKYEDELVRLQIELVKLQRWVAENGKRIAIIFEGRDAAGKGGTIRRFTEHLNPRAMRVVALPKPTDAEKGQWYFQRYSVQLPNPGEIVFFDRSWYNRAVVEPVNGFCSKAEYQRFMQQVPEFEHMLYEDGLILIKFWFSIAKEEQAKRFESRKQNPLKQWKLSPIDEQAQNKWEQYTHYKEEMFSKTHTSYSPWILVKANNKLRARLESIRYVLNHIPYDDKVEGKLRLCPDPNIITRFHRNVIKID
ncbi:MAG: polyphosphate kinase 2 [Candidatus Obscuribacter sp.]|nr:polyphosphate kinase 2 [Candidatus Obscuribacter sp.]